MSNTGYIMDPRFAPHNTHFDNPALFAEQDPQLRLLNRQIYVFHSKLINQLPDAPGIYTLGGGRQIGKSTLLKQWMLKLLTRGVDPNAIVFLSGELINDHHALLNILQNLLNTMPRDKTKYILLDEVTYIKDWDKTVKYLADAGLLENVVLMLTGSDLTLIQEARMRFPGRRGQSDIINFHLYPLSFQEVVGLKNRVPNLDKLSSLSYVPSENEMDGLFNEFGEYLEHGGYLTAINDLAAHGSISKATLITYSDWIRGDVLKRHKQEHYLREILTSIIKRYNSQVSWNALAKDLSIDHPKTVADYAQLLESMDALFIQSALIEDKLYAAPKKGKKLVFTDPFIFHAIRSWLWPDSNPYKNQIMAAIHDNELCSKLVEALVATHCRRYYPTYYISAEAEVDVAYVKDEKFWPIEVKWTNQLRSKDLKQILKYGNGIIYSKSKKAGFIDNIPAVPLPLALFRFA